MLAIARLVRLLAMAVGLADSIRNARADEVSAAVDGGAGPGQLVLYDGTRPAKGGAATNEVATLTYADPSFPAAAAGAMTANAITSDTDATGGTTTWARMTDSTGAFVADMSVGTSGADLNLDNTTISAGATVSVSSFTWTEGNA